MRPTATRGPTSATLASEPLALFSRATPARVRAGGDAQQLRQATSPAEILPASH